MTLDASHRDQEAVDLQPLLGCSDGNEAFREDCTFRRRRGKKNPYWKLVLGVVAVLLLIIHVSFVALLRKATVTLDQLILPDLCHRKTAGEVILTFRNPSYCSPVVGPLSVTLAKKNTVFLHIQVAAFKLQSGVTAIMSSFDVELLTSPEVLYSLVLADGENIDVHGQVPVLVSCMLVPFMIHLDVSNLLRENPRRAASTFIPPKWRYVSDTLLHGADAWESGVVNGIKTELEHVVKRVLKTIALSHFHTETDEQKIFAFTDVSFEYASRVLWNVPSLSVEIQSAERQTILVAGLKRFLLGNGQTFISAYTQVFKSQSEPLQLMLQSYLAGNDVVLHVGGSNYDTDCYSLQILDYVDIKVNVPAKIDNKPALLREYFVTPLLKELDSNTHRCLLELKVYIKINNPLPIQFDFYGIELDLLYAKTLPQDKSRPTFLLHVKDIKHVSWASHEENSIVLDTAVYDFDTCMEVVGFYLRNQLTFDIQHGRIFVGAGSGNFSIPFSTKGIHIRPGLSNKSSRFEKSSPNFSNFGS